VTLHHSLNQFFYLLIFCLVVFFCLLEFNILWDLLDDCALISVFTGVAVRFGPQVLEGARCL